MAERVSWRLTPRNIPAESLQQSGWGEAGHAGGTATGAQRSRGGRCDPRANRPPDYHRWAWEPHHAWTFWKVLGVRQEGSCSWKGAGGQQAESRGVSLQVGASETTGSALSPGAHLGGLYLTGSSQAACRGSSPYRGDRGPGERDLPNGSQPEPGGAFPCQPVQRPRGVGRGQSIRAEESLHRQAGAGCRS